VEKGEKMSGIFSLRIRELRLKKNISQLKVARLSGVSKSSYNYYELDDRKPTLDAIIKLADFFEVSADYLIGRTNDPDEIRITNLPEEYKEMGINHISVSLDNLIKMIPKESYDKMLDSIKKEYKKPE
jgi:transcriptional regulator with XRE-family HTH domain